MVAGWICFIENGCELHALWFWREDSGNVLGVLRDFGATSLFACAYRQIHRIICFNVIQLVWMEEVFHKIRKQPIIWIRLGGWPEQWKLIERKCSPDWSLISFFGVTTTFYAAHNRRLFATCGSASLWFSLFFFVFVYFTPAPNGYASSDSPIKSIIRLKAGCCLNWMEICSVMRKHNLRKRVKLMFEKSIKTKNWSLNLRRARNESPAKTDRLTNA